MNKVEKLKQNASLLGLHSIRAFCFDATKALKLDMIDGTEGNLVFLVPCFLLIITCTHWILIQLSMWNDRK